MTDQYGQMMAGTSRERLVQAVAATSDANGLISLRLGPCPLGYVWQGSITVTNAPSGALLNASVASTPWGQWAGPTNFGPVQLWGNETLIVTGVGMQKNTQYSMLFVGISMPEQLAIPVPPVAPLSTVAVETSTLLVNGQSIITNANQQIIITPPSLTRRLTIVFDSTNGGGANTFELIGSTTGAVYWLQTGILSGGLLPNVYYAAVEPSVDQTYILRCLTTNGGTVLVWITANTSSPLIVGEQDKPITIAQPVAVVGPSTSTISLPVNAYPTIINTAKVTVNVVNTKFTLIAAPAAASRNALGTLSILVNVAAVGFLTLFDGANEILQANTPANNVGLVTPITYQASGIVSGQSSIQPVIFTLTWGNVAA